MRERHAQEQNAMLAQKVGDIQQVKAAEEKGGVVDLQKAETRIADKEQKDKDKVNKAVQFQLSLRQRQLLPAYDNW